MTTHFSPMSMRYYVPAFAREPIHYSPAQVVLMMGFAAAIDPGFDDKFEASIQVNGFDKALANQFNVRPDGFGGYLWVC